MSQKLDSIRPGTSYVAPTLAQEMADAEKRAQDIRKMLGRNLAVFRKYIAQHPPDGLTVLALIRRAMTEAGRRSPGDGDVENVERLQAEALSKRQSSLAKKRHSKPDRKQTAKGEVRDCWERWRAKPEIYKNKSAFARDMLDKFTDLTSEEVIKRWIREWETIENPAG